MPFRLINSCTFPSLPALSIAHRSCLTRSSHSLLCLTSFLSFSPSLILSHAGLALLSVLVYYLYFLFLLLLPPSSLPHPHSYTLSTTLPYLSVFFLTSLHIISAPLSSSLLKDSFYSLPRNPFLHPHHITLSSITLYPHSHSASVRHLLSLRTLRFTAVNYQLRICSLLTPQHDRYPNQHPFAIAHSPTRFIEWPKPPSTDVRSPSTEFTTASLLRLENQDLLQSWLGHQSVAPNEAAIQRLLNPNQLRLQRNSPSRPRRHHDPLRRLLLLQPRPNPLLPSSLWRMARWPFDSMAIAMTTQEHLRTLCLWL